MDTDAAAAQFHAVEHDIVSQRLDPAGIGFQEFQVIRIRHGEGMMHRIIPAVFLIVLQQREIGDPQEMVLVFVQHAHPVRQFPSQEAQGVEYDFRLVRHDEQEVSLFRFHPFKNGVHFLFSHKLGKRRCHLFAHLDPGQALCAEGPDQVH